jgi:hypothetical protein
MSRRTFAPLVVAAAVAVFARDGAAQSRMVYRYAAKVVCGAARDSGGVVAQRYATTINIYADSTNAVLTKSLIITIPPGAQRPQRPSVIGVDSLPAGWALASDCSDMSKRTQTPPFFEGFLIIESSVSLTVVGVYTVPGGVDVVNVPERRRPAR